MEDYYITIKSKLRSIAKRQIEKLLKKANKSNRKFLYESEIERLIEYEKTQINKRIRQHLKGLRNSLREEKQIKRHGIEDKLLEEFDNYFEFNGKTRYIYFFQLDDDGYIKIGCSTNPYNRISTIKTSIPYDGKIQFFHHKELMF